MLSIERFQTLKALQEKLEREAQRAEGGKKQLLNTLKQDFDCNSIQKAEKLLSSLKKELEELEEEFKEELEKMEETYEKSKRVEDNSR